MTTSTRYTLAIGHNVAGHPHWSGPTVAATIAANWPFPGFTLQPARGRWEGVEENTTLLTYLGEEADEALVVDAARVIAAELQQDAIMVTAEPVRVAFIAPQAGA